MKTWLIDTRLLVALLCAVFGCANANDGVGQVSMGGIISMSETNAVTMKSEVLEVGWQKIRVAYEFENATKSDVKLPVVFPLPAYQTNPYSPIWAGQPRGFVLAINGKRAPFQTHVIAERCFDHRLSCLNVTSRLREVGLTDEQIAYFPSYSPFEGRADRKFSVKKLTKPQTDALIRDGLLVEGDEFGVNAWPRWRVSIVYSWNITFPAQSITKVEHEYAPFGSGGSPHSIGSADDLDRFKEFCVDANFKSSVGKALKVFAEKSKEQGNHGYGLHGTAVEYILSTANTWKGPIKNFTLRVRKSRPDELVSFCFPGNVRKIDALTFETTLTDFSPNSELSVLFVNTSDFAAGPWGPYNVNSEPPVLNSK